MVQKIVALSGGMDSATLLGVEVAKKSGNILAVGFSYGSKHNVHENRAATAVAGWFGVPYRQIDLTPIMINFQSNLLHSGGSLPEGHYQEESMRKTVVPGRNMIFISILSGIAESEGAKEVHLGIHAGDHFIYPDCRPNFFEVMRLAVNFSSEGKVVLEAPFLHNTKADILNIGFATGGIPYHFTRTCYTDKAVACGKCGACQERLEAFDKLGKRDPIGYETRDLIPKS